MPKPRIIYQFYTVGSKCFESFRPLHPICNVSVFCLLVTISEGCNNKCSTSQLPRLATQPCPFERGPRVRVRVRARAAPSHAVPHAEEVALLPPRLPDRLRTATGDGGLPRTEDHPSLSLSS